MKQVLEMSDASIMRRLSLDESEWSDMVAEQRQIIVNLRDERDAYQEINRILLRENLDIKDVLRRNDIIDSQNLCDLEDLFSSFSALEKQDDSQEESEVDDIGENSENNESSEENKEKSRKGRL